MTFAQIKKKIVNAFPVARCGIGVELIGVVVAEKISQRQSFGVGCRMSGSEGKRKMTDPF